MRQKCFCKIITINIKALLPPSGCSHIKPLRNTDQGVFFEKKQPTIEP
jgi:hypothetical protein